MPTARKSKAKAVIQAPEGEPHKMGYARVSMVDQNPQMQRDALIAAGVDPRDIFEDTASGASTAKRPEFAAMMKDCRAGDIVYAWKLDRLGRNAIDLYQTAQAIQDKGARLVILTMPGMDTATPMGRAMFGMLAVFAEFERAMILERTMAGLAAARAKGRIGGRRSVYPDADVLDAAKLGTLRGMKKLGMKSKAGFLRRLKQAQEAQEKQQREQT